MEYFDKGADNLAIYLYQVTWQNKEILLVLMMWMCQAILSIADNANINKNT